MNGPLFACVLVSFPVLLMLNIGFLGRRDYSWPIIAGSFLFWFLPLWYIGGYAVGVHPFIATMALLFLAGGLGFHILNGWMRTIAKEPFRADAPGREIRNRDQD